MFTRHIGYLGAKRRKRDDAAMVEVPSQDELPMDEPMDEAPKEQLEATPRAPQQPVWGATWEF
jgi:hypothetical protein